MHLESTNSVNAVSDNKEVKKREVCDTNKKLLGPTVNNVTLSNLWHIQLLISSNDIHIHNYNAG